MLGEEAREYHAFGRPGKIAIAITKPCATQHDLALAYTWASLGARDDHGQTRPSPGCGTRGPSGRCLARGS